MNERAFETRPRGSPPRGAREQGQPHLTQTTLFVLVLSLLFVLPLFKFTFHALEVLLDTELEDAFCTYSTWICKGDGIPVPRNPGKSPG